MSDALIDAVLEILGLDFECESWWNVGADSRILRNV